MSLPTLDFRTVTVCTDARCTATGTCWRAANERYGDAPGENYGPRCVPVPPLASGAEAIYALGVEEGERRATAAVVAWLREHANMEHPIERGVPSLSPAGRGLLLLHADAIERGEHRREEER